MKRAELSEASRASFGRQAHGGKFAASVRFRCRRCISPSAEGRGVSSIRASPSMECSHSGSSSDSLSASFSFACCTPAYDVASDLAAGKGACFASGWPGVAMSTPPATAPAPRGGSPSGGAAHASGPSAATDDLRGVHARACPPPSPIAILPPTSAVAPSPLLPMTPPLVVSFLKRLLLPIAPLCIIPLSWAPPRPTAPPPTIVLLSISARRNICCEDMG